MEDKLLEGKNVRQDCVHNLWPFENEVNLFIHLLILSSHMNYVDKLLSSHLDLSWYTVFQPNLCTIFCVYNYNINQWFISAVSFFIVTAVAYVEGEKKACV